MKRQSIRDVRFFNVGIRMSAQERALLRAVATQLERTPSDVVRMLVRGAALELGAKNNDAEATPAAMAQPKTTGKGEQVAIPS